MEKAAFTRKYLEDVPGLDSPEGWRRFLDFVLSYADSFCLSFYTDCGPFRALSPEDFCASPWGFLSASISDWEVTDQSPVTARTPMLLLYFRLDPVTVSFLRGRRTVLDFPPARLDRGFLCFDDLAFLKAGKIFFCSCTHERFCSIDGDVHRLYQGNPLQPISELDTETGWQRFLDFALSCADGFSLSFRAASPVVASVEEFRASQWGFLYPSAHSQEVADLPLSRWAILSGCSIFSSLPLPFAFSAPYPTSTIWMRQKKCPLACTGWQTWLSTSRGTVSSPPGRMPGSAG